MSQGDANAVERGMVEGVFDAIAPQPVCAVQKARDHKHGGGDSEAGEDGEGDVVEIAVAVVHRDCEGAVGQGIAAMECVGHTGEAHRDIVGAQVGALPLESRAGREAVIHKDAQAAPVEPADDADSAGRTEEAPAIVRMPGHRPNYRIGAPRHTPAGPYRHSVR